MHRILNAREFIQETLIDEFGSIVNGKEKHDYLSLLLISCGIEFLGKCMAPVGTSWHHSASTHYFKQGISLFPDPYKRYSIDEILYHGLRCGICHALLPSDELIVSSTAEQNLNSKPIRMNIYTFYQDFKDACKKLLNEPTYQIRLSEPFISIAGGTTGGTETNL